MATTQRLEAHPRRRMALALLATTALATLLGGCMQTGLPFARSEEPKLSATDAIGAVAQYSAAYNKNPQDPKIVLGYAAALKAIGSRDKALEILTAGYQANQNSGEIAAELGRLALDMNRLDIAQQTLKVAETQGVKDWKTLSAQGTLRAKQGQHAEAQQYFLAALQEQPDAVSVTNNLALSYALDGKPNKAEELLRKAVASGHDDKRVRQNLALVLGLEGKFDEARKVATLDMSDQDAKSNMTYLRNMMSNPTQFAVAASPGGADGTAGDDWEPFDSAASKGAASSKSAAVPQVTAPKVQVVKAAEEIEAPSVPQAAQAPAKPRKVAGTPTLITPANASPTPGGVASLLRTDTD
jgi:Flp pilus assembly protein TadD